MNISLAKLKFDQRGLIPTIVRSGSTILMLAYSSRQSLRKAFSSGKGWYYSRNRGLWKKGATSGNTQKLLAVSTDCDRDALIFDISQKGVACCTGKYSCFGDEKMDLLQLYSIIAGRKNAKRSYTVKLLADKDLVNRKLNEECFELIAAKGKDQTVWEAADVLYFLTVILAQRRVSPREVFAELKRRRK